MLAKVPEGGGQPQFCKQRFGLINCSSPPCRVSPVRTIPGLRQAPCLFQGQQRAAWQLPLLAPVVDMLFRPEEKHGLSVEDDVIPPVMGRDSKMNDAGVALYLIINHL
jgi:hypothetical protein